MRKAVFGAVMVLLLGLSGCAGDIGSQSSAGEMKAPAEAQGTEAGSGTEKKSDIGETQTDASGVIEAFYASEPETEVKREAAFHFVDVYGEEYETVIRDEIEKNHYDWDCLTREGDRLRYEDEDGIISRLGVDVSYYQGDIDWEKVRADGVEFAFIRLGFRGYGKEGEVCLDRRFHEYMEGAAKAGLETGVYFFSQAVNEKEAEEEAAFVLEQLKAYEPGCTVVYDPESILSDDARTDDVTGEQFTANTKAFCEKVEAAGYPAMIYCNMLWQAFELDLAQLAEYPVWYADYEPLPQTPYQFEYWQYTNKGTVDGISGEVDLNIRFLKKSERS